MATKQALEVNRRRHEARAMVMRALSPLGDGFIAAWKTVKYLERAAIACGEVRERGRRARRGR